MVDRASATFDEATPLLIKLVMRAMTKSRQEKSIFETAVEIGRCQGQETAGKVILIIRRSRNFGIQPLSRVIYSRLAESGKARRPS